MTEKRLRNGPPGAARRPRCEAAFPPPDNSPRTRFLTSDNVLLDVANASVTPSLIMTKVIQNAHRASQHPLRVEPPPPLVPLPTTEIAHAIPESNLVALRHAPHLLPNVAAEPLEEVLKYTYFHTSIEYREINQADLTSWDEEFVRCSPRQMCELASAAYYLDIRDLVDLTCRAIAATISGKSADEIRTTFHIENDLVQSLIFPRDTNASSARRPSDFSRQKIVQRKPERTTSDPDDCPDSHAKDSRLPNDPDHDRPQLGKNTIEEIENWINGEDASKKTPKKRRRKKRNKSHTPQPRPPPVHPPSPPSSIPPVNPHSTVVLQQIPTALPQSPPPPSLLVPNHLHNGARDSSKIQHTLPPKHVSRKDCDSPVQRELAASSEEEGVFVSMAPAQKSLSKSQPCQETKETPFGELNKCADKPSESQPTTFPVAATNPAPQSDSVKREAEKERENAVSTIITSGDTVAATLQAQHDTSQAHVTNEQLPSRNEKKSASHRTQGGSIGKQAQSIALTIAGQDANCGEVKDNSIDSETALRATEQENSLEATAKSQAKASNVKKDSTNRGSGVKVEDDENGIAGQRRRSSSVPGNQRSTSVHGQRGKKDGDNGRETRKRPVSTGAQGNGTTTERVGYIRCPEGMDKEVEDFSNRLRAGDSSTCPVKCSGHEKSLPNSHDAGSDRKRTAEEQDNPNSNCTSEKEEEQRDKSNSKELEGAKLVDTKLEEKCRMAQLEEREKHFQSRAYAIEKQIAGLYAEKEKVRDALSVVKIELKQLRKELED